MATSVDLSVNVGALKLTNPIIAASGTFGYGLEFSHLVDLNRLGGIVVKGLSIEAMDGAPAPRMCETASGMLNAVGLQNVGVRAFVAEKLPKLRGYQTAVVANVFGKTVQEYVQVVEVLEGAEGLAAYELNISCPNVKQGGAHFGSDPRLAAEVVEAVRKVARRPLWVKLSPNVTHIAEMAMAVEAAGADVLTVANTYFAMSVDLETRKSRLGKLTGGLSGPAIKPITLRLVYETCRAVRIPVIGLGGIETAGDAAEYMMVGAAAVQVGTASFVDPRATERLVEGLENWCFANKICKLNELRGTLKE
ncbi:MAG: dihydroorotate dehydrogenase [Acidobacteria bacterium]|nr:dihydroorotate dehydrogenase [Acidobacteriota bacterium]